MKLGEIIRCTKWLKFTLLLSYLNKNYRMNEKLRRMGEVSEVRSSNAIAKCFIPRPLFWFQHTSKLLDNLENFKKFSFRFNNLAKFDSHR